MKRRAILSALVMALASGAIIPSVQACGLEGGLGDAFSVAHDGSLAVAFAASDAIASGWLIPDRQLAAEAAHDRADDRLQAFVTALPLAPRGALPFAVLLVEPGIWTRVSLKAGRWTLTQHVEKPAASETVMLASEAALRNLIGGVLAADQALAKGLLTVHGEAAQRDRLITILRQTFPERGATTALR